MFVPSSGEYAPIFVFTSIIVGLSCSLANSIALFISSISSPSFTLIYYQFIDSNLSLVSSFVDKSIFPSSVISFESYNTISLFNL